MKYRVPSAHSHRSHWLRLRLVARFGSALLVAFFGAATVDAALTTNSWKTNISDKWEIGSNWSLGVPAPTHSAICITNDKEKTVTVDASTVASNALNNCLTVSNVVMSCPQPLVNTLRLNGAGVATPLRVLNSVTLTTGGWIRVFNSALQVGTASGGGFRDDGTVTLESGAIVATNVPTVIGQAGAGQMIISRGTWLARDVVVGGLAGASGTLTVDGGSAFLQTTNLNPLLVGNAANATGAVWVTEGELVATNAALRSAVGFDGIGTMVVSNAEVRLWGLTMGSLAGARGTLTMAGGIVEMTATNDIGFRIASAAGTIGAVWMTGGELILTNAGATSRIGDAGRGQMTVSNGIWRAGEVVVGRTAGGLGTLTVAGGTNVMTGPLRIGGPNSTGTVWVTGGQLVVTNTPASVGAGTGFIIDGDVTLTNGSAIIVSNVAMRIGNVGSGSLINVGGSLNVSNLTLGFFSGAVGTLTLSGASTNTVRSFFTLGQQANTTGTVWLSGSRLITTNVIIADGGVGSMNMSGGVWNTVGTITVGAARVGTLTQAGGILSVSPTLFIGNSGNSTGVVWLTGGQMNVTNGTVIVGSTGVGELTVSNAVSTVSTMVVSVGGLKSGTFTVAGGSNSVYVSLTVGGTLCNHTGIVNVVGGRLFVTNSTSNARLEILGGRVTINSGTLAVNQLVMSNACGRLFNYGGNLSISSTHIDGSLDADGDGLPNSFETDFGLDPFNDTGVNGADGDLDDDGFTNLQELNGGFDPTDQFSNANCNNWATSSSGKWELASVGSSPKWSLGIPPATNHSIFISRVVAPEALPNTVTIDSATILSNAINGCLTVSNLTILSQDGSSSTLQLTNTGLSTPLRITDSCVVSNGCTLLVTNSALVVDRSFSINGTVTLLDGASVVATNKTAEVNLNPYPRHRSPNVFIRKNGTFEMNGGSLSVGSLASSSGTLTIAGGTNTLASLLVGYFGGGTSTVWLTGGRLEVTNDVFFGVTVLGFFGQGHMVNSNCAVLARDVFVGIVNSGTLTIAGGSTTLSSDLVAGFSSPGTIWLTGGELTVTEATTVIGHGFAGEMTVSNGVWQARDVIVSEGRWDSTLTIAGGTSSVFSKLTIGDSPCTSTGMVNIVGGELNVTNALGDATLEVRSGTLTLSAGTLRVDNFVMTNPCAQLVWTSGTLSFNTALLMSSRDEDADGISNGFEQDHGLDPFNAADADLDADGDGFSNLQEFLTGTDATNSASVFAISAMTKEADNIRVTWMTGSGKTNTLARATDLTGGYADIFTATNTVGGTTNYLDVGAATNVAAFYYRIRLVP